MRFRLLEAFRGVFEGRRYLHRRSNLGDHVASFLFEDLYELGRSPKLVERIDAARSVLNTANVAVGRDARRGDGTFGESVPGIEAVVVPDFAVRRGRIASVEIGAETKILAKAMIKQIDRVANDLRRQAEHIVSSNPRAIRVAIVGINRAPGYVSFEGDRAFATDGRRHKHPSQEADEAESRLATHARPGFDEFIVLRFRATNTDPYPFEWDDEAELRAEYGAALARISREYEQRF